MIRIAKRNKQKILITAALPYANGSIHVGHLVEYIQTDIFVRFLKLIGEDAIFCCADDTHGAPIEINARQLGITPEQLIEKSYKEHTEDFAAFHIDFDSYYSTNSKDNKEFADLIFLRLKEKGHIYTKPIHQYFCKKCGRFLPDRYIKGVCPKCGALDQYGDVCEQCSTFLKSTELINPYCTLCKTTPVIKESTHYFFRLSDFSDWLSKWIDATQIPEEIKNHVRSWITSGLEDWCVSRDGPYFGFRIPGEENKYYYVWLDAPIGYISSTKNYCNQHNVDFDQYWHSDKSRIIHVIGKDIIYFHLLFWPAMLKGAQFTLPSQVQVHGFLTVNGAKMSKSRGTFFTARDFLKEHNPEHLRYYYAAMLGSKVSDIDLDFDDYQEKVNGELVANIGNFCYRVLSFTKKYFDSSFGEIERNESLEKEMLDKVVLVKEAYSSWNFKDAIRNILEVSALGNKFMQETAPWALIKEDHDLARRYMGFCVNVARNLAIMVSPVMPKFAESIFEQIGIEPQGWDSIGFDIHDHRIADARIVIQKIEKKEAAKERFPLNLKVAKIVAVTDHPDAEKLYVIQLDLGPAGNRQIVAGIRKHYSKEDLIGKKIVIVSNLKPAKLRGIESNGMLLAAEDRDLVRVLEAKGSNPGDSVTCGDLENNAKQIDYKEFETVKLIVTCGRAGCAGKLLKAGEEYITCEQVGDGSLVH